MSIDSPNAQMPANDPKAADFNYIDTYVEFVAEVILKYDNAIPELKNRQQKLWQMQKQYELIFQKIEPVAIVFYLGNNANRFTNYITGYSSMFIREINPPPPKSC